MKVKSVKVKSEIEVAQSCPTLNGLMDCSPPGSSIHGIFQTRVLEWGAIAFSPVSSKRLLIALKFDYHLFLVAQLIKNPPTMQQTPV